MSDNRIDQLFPDVTEQYNNTLPTAGEQGFPVPQATQPAHSATADTAVDHVEDLVGVDSHDHTTYDDDYDIDPDPLAHGPDWVRAHIPRYGLVVAEESRRALSARLSRRKATPASPVPVVATEPIVSTEDASEDEPATSTPVEKTTGFAGPFGTKRGWAIGSAVAAVVAVIVGAGIVALDSDDSGAAATAIAPVAPASPTTNTPATTATAAPWCESSSAAGTVTGRGPGEPSTGPGLIQAFDYAYYVERDSAKVASMMLNPSRVEDITTSIADAANRGVQHCVTIVSTPDPAVFDVALQLRTAPTAQSVVAQHITIATTATGPKIGTIVEVTQ